MYSGDREKVAVLLERAQHITGAGGEEHRRILLSNLDRATEIAREYYSQKPPARIQEVPLVLELPLSTRSTSLSPA
jgi:hypothetical protein